MRCCQGAAVLLRLLLLVVLFSGFVLSCKAATSCRFLFYESDHDDGYVGLFSFEDSDECIPHQDLDVGPATMAAKTGAVAAPIISFFALLLGTVEFLSGRTCLCRHLVPSLLLVAAFMQGLTFLLLSSGAYCDVDTVRDFIEEAVYNRSCTMSSGSWRSLIALLIYLTSAILYWIAPMPTEPICAKWKNSLKDDDAECIGNEVEHKRYTGATTRIGTSTQSNKGENDEESLAGYGNESGTLATYDEDAPVENSGVKAPRARPRVETALANDSKPQRRAFDPAIFQGGRKVVKSSPINGGVVCISRESGHAESLQDDEDRSQASTHWKDEESLAGYGLSRTDISGGHLPHRIPQRKPDHHRCDTEESLAGYGNETLADDEDISTQRVAAPGGDRLRRL